MTTIISNRTSMLSSVNSLPRSPQSIPSNYTSGALSPNFTPALTPLVNRSPSVSSLGSPEDYIGHNVAPTGIVGGLRDNPMMQRENPAMHQELRRDSVVSGYSNNSRITLSDLNPSDPEVEV